MYFFLFCEQESGLMDAYIEAYLFFFWVLYSMKVLGELITLSVCCINVPFFSFLFFGSA